MFGQVRGSISDLLVKDGKINFTFKGSSGEISKPSIQVTAENSDIEFTLADSAISMKAEGTVFDGAYSFDINYDYHNDSEPLLTIHNLSLKKANLKLPKSSTLLYKTLC